MNKRLFIGNVPYTATEQELRELFSQVGTVSLVRLPIDGDTQKSRGFGFVEMATETDAHAAIQRFDGARMGHRTLKVQEANERPPRPRQERHRGRDRRETAGVSRRSAHRAAGELLGMVNLIDSSN